MIREIVFVDEERVGFIMADQMTQGTLLQPKFIHVGDLVKLELAGFRDQDIAPMFADAPRNCRFSTKWAKWLPNHESWTDQ